MSEAADAPADTFDAEFAAARDAERDDTPPEVSDEAEESESEPGEETSAELEAKVDSEVEKANKRATDLQKALKQERRKRQEDERKFNERLAALETGAEAKEAPLTPEALLAKLRDDDEDPIGDIATVKQLAKLLVGQTQEETQADAQARQRAQALQVVSTTMADYESDFRELNADYDKAAAHFMKARQEEIADTGVSGDALTLAMQNEFAGIVSRSIAAGKDPAEIIYNMAKRRGFASTVAADAAVTKLDTIERGQAQAKTLSGGGTTSGNLTAGQVSNLKGAAFDAAFEKLRASERRR